ncbi:hypothetical protein G7Y89_g3406 [Cudoniella acicularis]|uniref:Rhodopsin domain-containing protein n=1 Tax=Cudoniella acicularis TaxID=354080 RepID=A0A8H4W7P3_9HELO|nr:hypothetical protein G7Y89_g3406 [Cudoniella acicularis]
MSNRLELGRLAAFSPSREHKRTRKEEEHPISASLIQAEIAKVNEKICEGTPVESRAWAVTITALVGGPLAIAAVVLRCYSRYSVARQFGSDDSIIVISTAVLIVLFVLEVYNGMANGFGLRIWDLDPNKVQQLLKIFYIAEILYVVNITLIKTFILLFYGTMSCRESVPSSSSASQLSAPASSQPEPFSLATSPPSSHSTPTPRSHTSSNPRTPYGATKDHQFPSPFSVSSRPQTEKSDRTSSSPLYDKRVITSPDDAFLRNLEWEARMTPVWVNPRFDRRGNIVSVHSIQHGSIYGNIHHGSTHRDSTHRDNTHRRTYRESTHRSSLHHASASNSSDTSLFLLQGPRLSDDEDILRLSRGDSTEAMKGDSSEENIVTEDVEIGLALNRNMELRCLRSLELEVIRNSGKWIQR